MLGQKRGGRLRHVGPDIIEGSSGAGQPKPLPATSLGRKRDGKQEAVSQDVLKAAHIMLSRLKGLRHTEM